MTNTPSSVDFCAILDKAVRWASVNFLSIDQEISNSMQVAQRKCFRFLLSVKKN